MKSLLLCLSLLSVPAIAGQFDIDNPKILGQYKLTPADRGAEIQDVKIIYNNDGKLVLVRDEDQEYELEKADRNGLIFQGEDEPNCGSGDEADCYYDASIEVRLGETRGARGRTIPQITVAVERVDAYEANEDYSYTLVFNWSAEIEDAVPFYTNSENPAALQRILDECKETFAKVIGTEYLNNRVCHGAESYKIRQGIDPEKAFASLQKGWEAEALKKADLEKTLFEPSDEYIKEYASSRQPPVDSAKLISAAKKVRRYISENSGAFSYKPEIGSIAWLFALDSKNGVMYRYAIFMESED